MLSHPVGYPIPYKLETRTRFKEDCDPARSERAENFQRWKPGLASKRIATRTQSLRSTARPPFVGNQDSLQRGLRLTLQNMRAPVW